MHLEGFAMKTKTADLTGAALNWAVAKCEGFTEIEIWHTGAVTTRYPNGVTVTHGYSTNWAQGGPIIEREKIEYSPPVDKSDPSWMAVWYQVNDIAEAGIQSGPTPLIAAMRCYVASRLGDEIEVPNEVIQ